MTQSNPPLPQPQLEPAGITFDQYAEYTPEKLELRNGYLGYGGQDPTGFHLAVLTNMGLLVFYFPIDEGVEILRVIHGARDIEAILDEDLGEDD